MNVLGLSCWHHAASACLVQDGRIAAAASEERFTRLKHDPRFPEHAVAYCLREGGITAADLGLVAFYDKPLLKFERLLESYLAYAPKGLPSFLRTVPQWLKQKLWIPDVLEKVLGFEGPILYPEHHESHAASAFFPSPFERAAVLTADGVGEWATTSWGVGAGSRLDLKAELRYPHSLGLLYAACARFCGFEAYVDEYKLMGLAPYGEPRYVQALLDEVIDLKPDGSFRFHPEAFEHEAGSRLTGRRFEELFGGPPREPEGPFTPRETDLARSVQAVTEEAMLRMARHVHTQTGEANLCLAGGVALNSVANGRILREGPFERLWIQPAAGDTGGALGAALVGWHTYLGHDRTPDPLDAMQGAYLGPAFSDAEIEAALAAAGLAGEPVGLGDLPERVAGLLADGLTVGWFQGRMEFGPRALGHRSILADPRDPAAQRRVNLQIKFRESFRPFAPSVLADRAPDYFGLDAESPYMLLVAPVEGARVESRPRTRSGGEELERLSGVDSPVPAVTHVDGSARVQTVDAARSPLYWRLLKAFEAKTGCPVLANTSFNLRGEPIVCTPADAVRCFLNTHMDALALGPYLLLKDAIPGAREALRSPEEVAAAYGLD